MKRAAFEFLYIHANSIAELRMDQLAAGFELKMADSVDELAHLGTDEREAMALAQLSAMDMSSMMDGFKWETPEHDAAAQSALQALQAEAAHAESSPGIVEAESPLHRARLTTGAPDDPVPAALNLALYLERAYAIADRIALRVDAGMGRVAMARLDSLLADLPGNLAPLTGPLDADGLAQWLACYQSGHLALDELVTVFRGLAVER